MAARFRQQRRPSIQRGISLLELLFAILVVTTVIFMATRYVKVGQDGASVAQAITQVRTVVSASYDWLRAQPNFCGTTDVAGNNCPSAAQQVSLANLVKAKLLPEEFDNNDISPWHSELTVEPQGLDEIKITINDVPKEACYTLEGRLRTDKKDKTRVNCTMTSNLKGRFEGVF